MPQNLTRRQREIDQYRRQHLPGFAYPPSLDELCAALGLRSKGSLHKQIQALAAAGLVEPLHNRRRGTRLAEARAPGVDADAEALPFLGYIAAGQPIEAVAQAESLAAPPHLRTARPCYVLAVRGDSMLDDGIRDGARIVVEQRPSAHNGEIVAALIDGEEATLKRIEQRPDQVILHPANSALKPLRLRPDQVAIQGGLGGPDATLSLTPAAGSYFCRLIVTFLV